MGRQAHGRVDARGRVKDDGSAALSREALGYHIAQRDNLEHDVVVDREELEYRAAWERGPVPNELLDATGADPGPEKSQVSGLREFDRQAVARAQRVETRDDAPPSECGTIGGPSSEEVAIVYHIERVPPGAPGRNSERVVEIPQVVRIESERLAAREDDPAQQATR